MTLPVGGEEDNIENVASEESAGDRPPPLVSRPGRYARLRASIGRHPADVIRMAVAAAVVLLCLLVARSSAINPVESAIFTELERLPAWSERFWTVLTWTGSWPGITAAGGLALYAGRVRLASSLVASGVTAWLLAAVMHWVSAPRVVPPEVAAGAVRPPAPDGLLFPSTNTAVIAALACAGGPYLLSRAARQGSWVLVLLVAVAEIFLGRNLPVGVLAGAALGWGTGALYHLVLGAPGRSTSERAVQIALTEAGLPCTEITPVARSWLRPYEYDVITRGGEHLRMKVVRRLHRLAGPGYRLRQLLASVDAHDIPSLSSTRHEVEHEAYVTLLAERAGVGVLPVVLAGEIQHGPPFLVHRYVEGTLLSALPAASVSDTTLDRIWGDVVTLGRERLAHHGLRARHILIDVDGRPRITDFTLSRVGVGVGQVPEDIAELLVTLASVVGVRRAVDSAVRCVPVATLRKALPHLQWLAVHRRLRRQLDQDRATLATLRETLADEIDSPPPRFRSPVRPVTLGILLAVGLAIYLLLPELSSIDEVRDALAHADWRWIAVAIATGLLGVVASGVTVLGSSHTRLPVGKTMAVQLAAAFTGRTTAAGVGFFGINIVFLERLGLRRSQAVGAIFLNRAVVGVITGVATAVGILIIGSAVPVGEIKIPTGWPVITGVAVAIVVLVVVLGSPFGRRRVWRPLVGFLRDLLRDLVPTLRQPVRGLQLVGGSIIFLLLQAAGLAATLAAFDSHFPLVAVCAVYVVGSTLGQLAPTPGGLGAVEAATIAGLTAIGVSAPSAVAAVLTSRVLTFWLPALPGLVTFRLLQHYDVV